VPLKPRKLLRLGGDVGSKLTMSRWKALGVPDRSPKGAGQL
jgi:hypothetical protein